MRTHTGKRTCPHCCAPDMDDKHIGKCLNASEKRGIAQLLKNKKEEEKASKKKGKKKGE